MKQRINATNGFIFLLKTHPFVNGSYFDFQMYNLIQEELITIPWLNTIKLRIKC